MLCLWAVTPYGLVLDTNVLEDNNVSILRMETSCFSEMVFTYESTRHHNPEQLRHLDSRDNLKSQVLLPGLKYCRPAVPVPTYCTAGLHMYMIPFTCQILIVQNTKHFQFSVSVYRDPSDSYCFYFISLL
jgi:hypothetical protein